VFVCTGYKISSRNNNDDTNKTAKNTHDTKHIRTHAHTHTHTHVSNRVERIKTRRVTNTWNFVVIQI